MKAHKALQIIVLTFILTVGAILPQLITSPVSAQPTSGETTTLYFIKYDPFDFEEEFLFGPQLSLTPPTATIDSELPPAIFIKNESRRLPTFNFNTEELLTWMELWVIFKFSDLSDLIGDYDDFPDEFAQYFKNLFDMYNPYKIQEDYVYVGDETVEISGSIIYNLYFSSNSRLIAENDAVKISIGKKTLLFGMIPITTEIKNLTLPIKWTLTNQIKRIPISLNLENTTITVAPNEILTFSVEMIPSQRPISRALDFLEKSGIGNNLLNATANFLSNRKIESLQQFGFFIKDIVNTTKELNEEGFNISFYSALGEIFDTLRGSSFIYGSSTHPSHVILPLRLIGDTENFKTYYLHDQNSMDETKGINDNTIKTDFSKTPIRWDAPALARSKILKDANAVIYLNARNIIRKVSVSATLYSGAEILATSSQEISHDILLTKPNKPMTFSFTDINKEIPYASNISLTLAIANDSKLGLLGTVRAFYNSEEYPSLLSVTFDETDNIKIGDIKTTPVDTRIVPGKTVSYALNISSLKADNIQISSRELRKTGAWDVTIPSSVTVLENSITTIQVTLKSNNNLKEAYGNKIELELITAGNTGIDRRIISAEVSESAIIYNVEVLDYPQTINIKKGQNHTFYFIIKNNNTGAIDDVDSYLITASSQNNLPLIPRENIRNIIRGQSTDARTARVLIQVPSDTTITSDIITITVTSESNPSTSATITVSVQVLSADLDIPESFMLTLLLAVIVLFIFIILALMLTTKHVRLICTDRIKEVEANEKATYEVTLENRTKKQQSFDLCMKQSAPSSKWTINNEPLTISLQGKESKTVPIMVSPTDETNANDWTQVTILVNKTGKKKTQQINLITMMKQGKTLLQLGDVSHWPSEFYSGEPVTTSFSIVNKGTVTARNVDVFFYLNGKQKHKLTVTIPAGQIADIQIPWKAVKGKNKVRVRLKEQ